MPAARVRSIHHTSPLSRRRPGWRCALGWLLCLLPWLAAQAEKSAQDPDYLVDRWTTADGLPVNAINQVHLALDGYLWLATFDGLVRFDGYRFVAFGQADGLPGNRFMQLEEDVDGRLWVLSEQGALAYLQNGHFHPMGTSDGLPDAQVHTIGLDDLGQVWAGTEQGLARWYGERFVRGDGGLVRERVNDAVFDSPNGRHTVATGKAVFQFQHGKLLRHLAVGEQLPDGLINAVYWQDDTLWVAMNEGVVSVSADQTDTVIAGESFLRVVASHGRRGMIGPRASRWIDATGREWIESYPLHPANGRETVQRQAPDGALWENHLDRLERNGHPVFHARCTIKDFDFGHAGAVWVATACDGLWRLRPHHVRAITELDGVTLRSVYGLAQTGSGQLWIATLDHGMAVQEADGSVRWLGEAADFVGSSLRTLYPDTDGGIWVGQPGLCRMEGEVCMPPANLPSGLQSPDAHVRAIHRAADGALWVGSVNGLFRHDPVHGWEAMLERAGLTPAQATQVRTIAETPDGTLWFGMYGAGLLRRWPDGRFEHVGLEHGLASLAIRALRLDRDRQLWIATENRGLCLIRAPQHEAMRLSCMDRNSGLWSDSLHQILFDADDRLWLNSNQGVFQAPRSAYLAVLNGQAARIHPQIFTERDGLPSREGNGGVQDAGIVLHDGRLAFPTQQGIAVFDPANLPASAGAPRAVFESLLLPDGRRLEVAAQMALAAGERNLALHYTGLSPALTAPVYFRYRLGSDPDWTELGDSRQLRLNRLPPGTHHVALQAFDSSGAAGEAAQLELKVPAYWYETLAFRITVPALLVLLLLARLQHQRRTSRLQQQRLSDTVAERTEELRTALATVSAQHHEIEQLAQTQARFFANVSHELRTPLTLLVGPLHDLCHGHVPNPALAHAMLRNARLLQRLIDQLLDEERTRSGTFPLRAQHLDLAELAQESLTAFMPLAQRVGVALDARLPPLPVAVTGDSEQLMRLIGNLLSNALKSCPGGGQVRLVLQAEPSIVRLHVDDSGPGVPPEWRERIFSRFTRVGRDASQYREGMGLGLALCHEITQLHGGHLFVTDSPLGGARFVLELPSPEKSPLTTTWPVLTGLDQERPDPLAVAPEHEMAGPKESSGGTCTVRAGCQDTGLDQRIRPIEATRDTGSYTDRPVVLLVEDHTDLRTYIAGILSTRYRVLQAEDGEIALQRARAELPDLVVSDVMMPVRDGLALARDIRADPTLAGVPIVFLTARTADADHVTGLSGGADYYLTKPFTGDVLLAQLDAALRACQRLRAYFQAQGDATPPMHTPRATTADASDFVHRLNRLLESQAHDPSFGVAQMCSALHLSETSLRRRCHSECDAAPGDLLREHRLLRARQLLASGAGNVSEVGYAVGYTSLSAFSRAYRERFGHAPTHR